MHADRWDPFFDDLESQFTAQREAERSELDGETERVRIAGIALGDRLSALADAEPIGVVTRDGETVRGVVRSVGADWCAMRAENAEALVVVPLAAVRGVLLSNESARSSLGGPSRRAIAARMTLGFALRALARRRVAVRIALDGASTLTGTLARAGVDHADIALHDHGAAPRASDVAGTRMVPFAAIASVWIETPGERGVL